MLVREVLGYIQEQVSPPPTGNVVLFAGDQPESGIWEACLQYPVPGQQRLVKVHNAGALTQAHRVAEVCEAIAGVAGSYVVLTGDGFEEGQEEVRLSSRGQVIACSWPEDPDRAGQEKTEWLVTQLGNRELARAVLASTHFDFAAAAAFCDKLRRCGMPPQLALRVVGWSSRPPFADSLVLGERKAALRAAEGLEGEGIGLAIGQLAQRLGIMSLLYWASQDNLTGKELHKAVPEVPAFLVSRLRKATAQYSPQRMRAQRELLDIADTAYRNGARTGVLELLCAGW